MDTPTRDPQKAVPRTLLHADDVMLACESKIEPERQMQPWCGSLEDVRAYTERENDQSSYIKTIATGLQFSSS